MSLPRYARSADEAINRAHETLDSAKRRRAGSYLAWRPNVERDAQRRVNIRVTDEIVTALNERRIVMAYEPVVTAGARESAFYECLVRMEQDDGRVLLAPDIVPVAERLGLIRLVDHRVLELVIAELAASPDVVLSLNISPDTTMDPDWWATIESVMRANPGIGERLIVEITETVAIQDVDDLRSFVTRLKNFGSRIAIDDFGAGYTSFRNLRKLGVDIVKIDGAFVQNIVRSADDRAFVQTLIDLARRLDLKTVAEWVQDEEAAHAAARLGLRLHPGPADWSGDVGAAVGGGGEDAAEGGVAYLRRPARKCSAHAGAPQIAGPIGDSKLRDDLRNTNACGYGSRIALAGAAQCPGNDETYSSFFGSFDMRSSRSCISFICLRRSSMLPSSGGGSAGLAASAPRDGANGLNIEKVCWNNSMLRRTCSSSGAKGVPLNVSVNCLRNFSCSRVSVSIDCSRYFGTTICMLSP